MMTRRFFMGSLTLMTTAAGLGLGSVFVTRRRLSLAEIVPASVLPLQGITVSLGTSNGQSIRGIIEDVTAIRRPAQYGAPATEQISLLVVPGMTEPKAGTYHVKTDELDLGTLDFLPVGRPGREQRLEAVINRIV
jgi:hypothetical protein